MATVADNLNRIKNAKQDIKTAIEAKGVVVGEGLIDTYAEKISQIKGGAFDLTGTGWDQSKVFPVLVDRLDSLDADLDHTRQAYAKWSPSNPTALMGDKELIYAPKLPVDNLTSATNMFNGCFNLTAVPRLETGNVTNMDGMFKGCTSLNTYPDISTNKVTSMKDTFSGCSSIVTIPRFYTGKVVTFRRAFQDCTGLYELGRLDCRNVTDTTDMVKNCTFLHNTNGFPNLTVGIDFSTCSTLTSGNVINVFKDAAQARNSLQTFKLHPYTMKYLTPEDIKIATDKGFKVTL